MDDMRMVKFESLIEDINENLYFHRSNDGNKNASLSIVFDYEKCNDYAKVIIDHSQFCVRNNNIFGAVFNWYKDIPTQPYFNNPKDKIDAAKIILDYCMVDFPSYNEDIKLYFIFWNLMILTVDKSNAEEHLTLICDFAQMLHISDEEFEDIIQVIKMVYNRSGDRKILKSESVKKHFDKLLRYFEIT